MFRFSRSPRSLRSFASLAVVPFVALLAACSGAGPESIGDGSQAESATHPTSHAEDAGPMNPCDDPASLIDCAVGSHCEPRGINGAIVPVCIADEACDGGPAPDAEVDASPEDGGPETDADARCPAEHPQYGAPCSPEGLQCAYQVPRCGDTMGWDDVTCVNGKWHWYALGACPEDAGPAPDSGPTPPAPDAG